jgi:KaiC/GvpD/RAD55 family RecA-like ATPase
LAENDILICPETYLCIFAPVGHDMSYYRFGPTQVPLVKTGMPSFDETFGGLPERSVILLMGGTGTGAEQFAQQLLFHSARKGNRVIYVTIEKPPSDVREELASIGCKIDPLETTNPARWQFYDAFTPRRTQRAAQASLLSLIREDLAARNHDYFSAMDSLSYLLLRYDITDVMDTVEQLLHHSRQHGGVHLLIMNPDMHDSRTVHTILHIVDVALEFVSEEKAQIIEWTLQVRKMKRASHKIGVLPFRLTDRGILFETTTRVT